MKITRTITTTTIHVSDISIIDGNITGVQLKDIVIPGIVPEKKLAKIVKTTYPENPKALVTGTETVSALYVIPLDTFLKYATIVPASTVTASEAATV